MMDYKTFHLKYSKCDQFNRSLICDKMRVLTDRLYFMRHQKSFSTHSSCGMAGFSTCVATTDDNNIVLRRFSKFKRTWAFRCEEMKNRRMNSETKTRVAVIYLHLSVENESMIQARIKMFYYLNFVLGCR